MGSLRVGHDWTTSLSVFTLMHWRRKWQLTSVFLPGESQGRGSLVGCRLWGCTESDTTEATWQQQQQILRISNFVFFLDRRVSPLTYLFTHIRKVWVGYGSVCTHTHMHTSSMLFRLTSRISAWSSCMAEAQEICPLLAVSNGHQGQYSWWGTGIPCSEVVTWNELKSCLGLLDLQ